MPSAPFKNCLQRLRPKLSKLNGSFKLRGTSNRILQLSSEEKARGIIAVSSGNHGRAVTYLARRLGVKARVFVCSLCPESKRQAMRALGAEVIVHGAKHRPMRAA